MALKGNLRDFSISQLLNLINLARKTGTLIIDGPDHQKVCVSFCEGRLAYAQNGQEDGSLTAVLYRARKLTAAQQHAIQQRAGKMSDKELGLLLINAKYVTQQDIINSLQSYFIQVVNKLFTWPSGSFRFESGLLPPDDRITVRIRLENIIIEGTRRMKELEQLQDEIPSLDIAVKFAERPGANIRNVSLSRDEWRVVSYINPKNSLRQIARATNMSDLEIRRIIYGLLQAGLIEFTRPVGAKPPAQKSQQRLPEQQQNPAEKKSLIQRLINRIRSL